jgi:hypothetical protein
MESPGVPVRAVENDDGGELPEIGDDARARYHPRRFTRDKSAR